MNRRRALGLLLLLGLALLLGGCPKFPMSVGYIGILYYPQDPRVCPDGVYVGLDLPPGADVLVVQYWAGSESEIVPMLDATSFLVTKPALAPSTPEEAVSNRSTWDGNYDISVEKIQGTIRLHFHCEGSGRTQGEEGHVAPYDWRHFVLVEDPSRPSGLRVLEAEP